MLNKNPILPVYPDKPDFSLFPLRNGSRYMLDSNSLNLWKLSGSEEEAKIRANFTSSFRPQFRFGLPPNVASVCVEACHRCNLACDYCVSGDTKIPLLSGVEQDIKTLAESGEDFWVYSIDEDGKVVPGRAFAFPTRAVNQICIVTLDNGKKIRCTLDHELMMRDGVYRKAKDLLPGDSMMPLYRKVSDGDLLGYEMTYEPYSDRYHYTHRLVVGKHLPKNFVVHHKNFDKLNNCPSNLEIMGSGMHRSYHLSLLLGTHQGEEQRAKLSEAQNKLWSDDQHRLRMAEAFRVPKPKLKGKWATKEYYDYILRCRRVARARNKLNVVDPELDFLRDCNEHLVWAKFIRPLMARRRIAAMVATQRGTPKYVEEVAQIDREVEDLKLAMNHKIMSVEVVDLDEPEMMYDMEVDRYHNFALSAGIFSSNCFVKNYYPEGLEGITDFETAKKFLDTYCKGDSVQIGFFGGEPLMNMELITKVVAYVRGKYKTAKPFHVTTNGTLLTKKSPFIKPNQRIGEWLNENGFTSIVSLDGPEEAHNEHRCYKDGRGSFKDVMAGLEFMRGSNFIKRTTLRGTFTSGILATKYTLKDRIKFLNELVYSGLGSWVSVEPVVLSENSCVKAGSDLAMHGGEFLKQLEDQYFEVTDWMISEIKAGRKPINHQLTKWLERLFWKMHSATECGAGNGYMSVNWKGGITACFTGDTKFRTLSGKDLDFASHVGEEHWVYSYDHANQKIVPKLAQVVRTGTKRFISVVLDNGEKIRCTSDHRFMLRDGTYKEAKDLTEGQSLMPLHLLDSTAEDGIVGYHKILQPNGKLEFVHRMVARAFYKIKRGYCVHHKNFEKKDNDPRNLEVVEWTQHKRMHGELARRTLKKMWADPARKGTIGFSGGLHPSKKCPERWKKSLAVATSVASHDPGNPRYAYLHSMGHAARMRDLHEANYEYLKSKVVATRRTLSEFVNRAKLVLERYGRVTEETWELFNLELVHTKRKLKWVSYLSLVNNHKVLSVDLIETPEEESFCLTVEGTHNFALSSGVFSKNCHREHSSAIGDLTNGLDELLKSQWTDNRIYNRIGCMECPIRYICGGGCFTGETKVSLLTGEEAELKSLEGKDCWFYSYFDGKVVPAKGTVVRTQDAAQIWEVTLDNGEIIRCTGNHEFLCRSGEYIEASQLQSGDSVMPLYRDHDDLGYERVQDLDGSWVCTHKRVSQTEQLRLVSYKDGGLQDGGKAQVRHHKNYNKRDNTPDNLVWISLHDHKMLHAAVVAEHNRTPQMRESSGRRCKTLVSYTIARNKTQVVRDAVSARLTKSLEKDSDSLLRVWVDSADNLQRLSQYAVKEVSCDLCGKVFVNGGALGNHKSFCHADSVTVGKARGNLSRMQEIVNSLPKVVCDICGVSIDRRGFPAHKAAHRNHKVFSVVRTDVYEPVYCAMVYHAAHNFALSAGVFVHNCREESLGEYGDIRRPVEVACKIKRIWSECAMTMIDELSEDMIVSYVKNPRDNRRAGSPSKPTMLTGGVKKFVDFVSTQDTLVVFVDDSNTPSPALRMKLAETKLRVLSVKANLNPGLIQYYKCAAGDIVLLRSGKLYGNWTFEKFGMKSECTSCNGDCANKSK